MTNHDLLQRLQALARPLDPDSDECDRLMGAVCDYASNYLASIVNAPAFSGQSSGGSRLAGARISENGIGLDAALKVLGDDVDSVGINTTSGRFLGYIPGGGLFHSALGDFLAAVSNRYAGISAASPGAVAIENQLVRWMGDVAGYPSTSRGYLSTGGSMANLTAFVTARDHHGIEGERIAKSVVYLTEQVHHCVVKALGLIGLRSCVRRYVPVDVAHRMNTIALSEMIENDKKKGLEPWMIVASAGTTNTGSVDPLESIGEIAESHGLWYHVDGAYGGFFALCPEGASVLKGMDASDSLVMDPHKTLFLPYGTGALLVRDGRRLFASHAAGADYMQDTLDPEAETSPADLSPELTKHFRGLRLWLPLQVAGVGPFRAALSEKIHLARLFYERLSSVDGIEMGAFPDLSVVTYRFIPKSGDADAFNRALLKSIHDDGRIFVTSTQLNGRFTLRMAAVCFRTHRDDIETALEVITEKARLLDQ